MLLIAAAILLPLDVFLRRVIIGPRDVVEMVQAGVGRVIPALKPKRDRVAEALVAERSAMKERAKWAPKEKGAEVVAEQEQEGHAPEEEVPPSAEVMTTNRLREAKEWAKRRFER